MLKLKCSRCKGKISKPAALVFSPPDDHGNCRKFHVCIECWLQLALFVQGIEGKVLIGRKPNATHVAALFI